MRPQRRKVIVRGAEPEYTDAIPLFSVNEAALSVPFDQDMHDRRRTGSGNQRIFFPYHDAFGKTVRINGQLYEVIGVFEHDQGLVCRLPGSTLSPLFR